MKGSARMGMTGEPSHGLTPRPFAAGWYARLVSLLVLAVGGMALSACQPATALFVDKDSRGGRCDDARAVGEVSERTPWCSLERAVAAAPSGSIVSVRQAAYPRLTVMNSPARTAHLRLQGYRGDPSPPSLAGIYTQNATYLRWEGFRITGTVEFYARSRFIQLVGNDISPGGVRVRAANDLLIERNYIHDLTGSTRGIVSDGTPTGSYPGDPPGVRNLTIRANRLERIHHDGLALYHGVYNHVVEDNTFRDVIRPAGSTLHSDSIQVAPLAEGSDGVTIRRNFLLDGFQGILIKDGVTNGLVVENNIVARMAVWPMFVYDAPQARILNNTFPTGTVLFRSTKNPDGTWRTFMRNATVVNNIFAKMGVGEAGQPNPFAVEDHNLVQQYAFITGGGNDIIGSATFTAAGDYVLSPGSRGIDAGTSDHLAPSSDHLGNPRRDDPAMPNVGAGSTPFFDMGANERQP